MQSQGYNIMSAFDCSDEQLYLEMSKHPSAVVMKSIVPINSEQDKIFKYLYADHPKFMLGEGSFGKVFVCFYEGQGRIVKLALKIIDIPHNYDQIKTIQHIVSTSRQQVLALIKLRQNKNIIRIEDIMRQNNMIYIMLQYCNQRDLMYYFKKRKDDGKITKQTHIRYYFSQILHAFKELHQHNFMHRDIKPSNILVNNGVLKIADFGLCRQIVQGQQWKSFQEHVGTMITAAPQIVFKQQYTNKCDIYSLGTILYWMIYDRFPFTKVPTRQDFLEDKLQFPTIQAFTVSKQMITLLRQMLTYKENDRIDWVPMLQHQIFSNHHFTEYQRKIKSQYQKIELQKLRQTYGRNISNVLFDQQFLDTAIPSAYYKFLRQIQGEDKLKRWMIEQRQSLLKDTGLNAHKNIKDQYKNQQIILKLCRTILYQLDSLDFLKIIKQNKNEAQLIKSMLFYSIDKYMIYKMKKIKQQLVFISPPQIFNVNYLRQAQKQPLQKNFVDTVIQKFSGFEFMRKLSDNDINKIKQKCEDYHLYQDLGIIFDELNQGNISTFLMVVDQCIIQLVYFVKPEIFKIGSKKLAISPNDPYLSNTIKTLVVLMNHLFMFSMRDEMFPRKYSPKFPYAVFLETESEKRNFKQLLQKVTELIRRFQ